MKKLTLLQQEIKLTEMTQAQFAKKIRVTATTINNWIKGHTNISPRHVPALRKEGISNRAILYPDREVEGD